jgi:hypothetical protein
MTRVGFRLIIRPIILGRPASLGVWLLAFSSAALFGAELELLNPCASHERDVVLTFAGGPRDAPPVFEAAMAVQRTA